MEFAEVMRNWKRMCNTMNRCDECPLIDTSCWAEQPDGLIDDFNAREERIIKWATANPEPVYPTFREWLISIGVIDNMYIHSVIADILAVTPIPADIAQKLGIDPKEG